MPTVILDRIPLPNLKIYTTVSILLVSGCLYYSIKATSDPFWRLHTNSSTPNTITDTIGILGSEENGKSMMEGISVLESKMRNIQEEIEESTVDQMTPSDFYIDMNDKSGNGTRTLVTHLHDIVSFMSQEPVCIWTLINMAYCCLILLGKSIQKIVFGDLRISEQQHLKDKFWNFVFYKFIFVLGVINVQFLHEVILWIAWFSILGFLHLLSQLSKDRFEYLSFSPTTPGWSHFRLVTLLVSILTLSGVMLIIAICVGLFAGLNTFAFMSAECFLLAIKTSHVLVRYGMFLYDMRQGGMASDVVSWDKRGPYAYYTELVFDVAALVIDFSHHLHMLIWSNIFLSMASLVIIMQLRCLANEIQRKFKKHRNYLWVQNHMEKSYPLASQDDLSQNCDNCAICWEKMETARKLPCGHLFHNSCLQSWLEQDTSCPTCRLGLSVHNTAAIQRQAIDRIEEPEPNARINNHFFHFNGSRYVSWLPNFSVEVTNINNVLRPEQIPTTTHTSQIRNMARQVQEMFPRYPLSVIIPDLQLSRSIEVTVHNILEGRLQVPARLQEFSEDDFQETTGNNAPSTSNASNVTDRGSHSGLFVANSANEYYASPDFQHQDSSSSSVDSGYEIERNSNIFGNQNDLLRDDSLEDIPLGDRFSKSSSEREKILQRRKEMLLAQARKRYIEKNKSELNIPPASEVVRHRYKLGVQLAPE